MNLRLILCCFSIVMMNACNENKTMQETSSELVSTLDPDERLLFVGTYTRKEGHVDGKANGIYALKFNTKTGQLDTTGIGAETINPSYLAVDAVNEMVYAVNEIAGEEPNGGGKVKAFKYDRSAMTMKEVSAIDAMGGAPCYIMKHDDHLFSANYVGGNFAVYALANDGSISANTQVIQNVGKGLTSRQEAPHAHMITHNPHNDDILGVDLGIDEISVFNFNSAAGKLEKSSSVKFQDGSGPRHVDFHPTLKMAYVLNELNGSIDVLNFKDGNYKPVQNIKSTMFPDQDKAGCADIHVHPNGKFLYASNRGPFNTISLYNIQEDGSLKINSERTSDGEVPRAFTIDPAGNFVLIANQNSDNIAVLGIDQPSGRLMDLGINFKAPTPVCLKFE